ncbi:MAG: dTDP-glucose 4,6-dehydratase [Kiritimatiellia bacterium]|jgi:dTDP-glucose 4,6-dehydratase
MPRTVITGGAGFIGSHLCDRFIAEGHEVVCVDNLCTGSLENISHLHNHPRFTLRIHDVSQSMELGGPVDNVLHFASPASPKDFTTMPVEILRVGAHGTHNALELARRKGARFMLASTSEIYGDPEVHPQPETYRGRVDCNGIRSCYDEAKRFAEASTMAWHRYKGVDTRIVRLFNTYGERMQIDDGRALPNFIGQALRGEPITIYGDGSQTRSFGHVDDIVEGLWRLLYSGYNNPVNIGNPDEVTILQVAREVLDIVDSESSISFRPLPQGDPKLRRPDITRARTMLRWTPTISRSEGMRRTIDDFWTRMSRQVDLRQPAVA